MRIAILTVCMALGGALTGCAGKPEIPVQPVSIIGSDFCQLVPEKLTWDVKDTRPTIKGIHRLNAKWDAKCSTKAEKPTS